MAISDKEYIKILEDILIELNTMGIHTMIIKESEHVYTYKIDTYFYDKIKKDNAFFNFEGAWELEKKKVRADAINECIEMLNGIDKQVANLVKELFDLKEQNNDKN